MNSLRVASARTEERIQKGHPIGFFVTLLCVLQCSCSTISAAPEQVSYEEARQIRGGLPPKCPARCCPLTVSALCGRNGKTSCELLAAAGGICQLHVTPIYPPIYYAIHCKPEVNGNLAYSLSCAHVMVLYKVCVSQIPFTCADNSSGVVPCGVLTRAYCDPIRLPGGLWRCSDCRTGRVEPVTPCPRSDCVGDPCP